MTESSLIGRIARVVTAIAPGQEGEVMVDLPVGGTQAFPARAFDGKEESAAGEQVWVEEHTGRTLYVTKR